MATAERKMISVDEETYKQLIKAKATLELKAEKDISLGEAIGAIALGALLGYGMVKIAEELKKK